MELSRLNYELGVLTNINKEKIDEVLNSTFIINKLLGYKIRTYDIFKRKKLNF